MINKKRENFENGSKIPNYNNFLTKQPDFLLKYSNNWNKNLLLSF